MLFWCLVSEDGFLKRKLFHRELTVTVELLLEDGTEDRLAGHISFSLQDGCLDIPSLPTDFCMWHYLVHALIHNELCFSIVMTYL